MDELQISGKRFISARRIARENGYTSDYIGQLIRGGKIVGQKVGRAWYVDAASFDRYLGSESVEAKIEAVESEPIVVSQEVEIEEVKTEAPAPAPSTPAVEAPVLIEEIAVKETVSEASGAAAPDEVETVSTLSAPVEDELVEESKTTPVIVETKEEVIPVRLTTPPAAHVPLRIIKKEETTAETSGLRYYADDMPTLPEITKREEKSRIILPTMAEAFVPEVNGVEKNNGRRNVALFGSLAVVGIAVFAFVAVMSSSVTLNLSIHEGNAAATSYTFSW